MKGSSQRQLKGNHSREYLQEVQADMGQAQWTGGVFVVSLPHAETSLSTRSSSGCGIRADRPAFGFIRGCGYVITEATLWCLFHKCTNPIHEASTLMN